MIISIATNHSLFLDTQIDQTLISKMIIANSITAFAVIIWLGYSISKNNRDLVESISNEKNVLNQIFNNSVDALFLVDFSTDLVVDVNQRAVEMFEADNISQLLHIKGVTLQTHEFTEAQVANAFEYITKYGRWETEVGYRTFKNKLFWGHLGVSKFDMNGKTYNLVRVTDISAQKKYQQRIQDIELSIPGMLYQFFLTPEGKTGFNYVSPGSYQVAERTPEEFYKSIDSILNVERIEDFEGFTNKVIQSSMDLSYFEWEGKTILPSGKTKWLKATSVPNKLENGDIIWNGFLIDITDRKLSEEENIQLREVAEKALSVKDIFLSTMSHEIRTPLNSIIGLSHLLQLENKQASLQSKLEILGNSTQNLLQLVNNLLDINKINDGKSTVNLETFDLKILVGELETMFSHQITQSLDAFKIHIDENIETLIIGDKLKLQQVLSNLISNALKFTPNGSVSVNISLVGQNKYYQKLQFTVSDSGIGIAKEKQEDIFKMFVQADASITRKYGGSGLGLYISQKILSLFNSKLEVKSELGKGSTFSFSIEFTNPTLPETKPIELSVESDYLYQKSILIIEDNPVNTFVVKNFVELWQMTPTTAENGLDALQILENSTFDVILLDIQMPGMDGYEIAKLIRKKNQEIPIIALTANIKIEVESKAKSVGMNAVVTKPFQPKEMKKLIENTILRAQKIS
jgi:signal transduction histidine kinase/ActR/RegA family two-component response regulator